MSNLTLTVNLDSLTPTQLAALQVVVLAGVKSGNDQKAAYQAVAGAGFANCGNDYRPTYLDVADFLNGKEA